MITTTTSNINLAKGLVKMEEQLVPSAGYSPQNNSYGTDYTLKFSSYGFGSSGLDDRTTTSNYCNLADTFDLSLLGDSYDDQDMATVPSPSWSPINAMNETTCWQQSFYASSPSGDFNAYSPDCKPILANDVGTSPIHTSSYDNYEPHFNNSSNDGLINALAASTGTGGNRNLLLRQCLEDTSFQQKFNFKPMDLPPMSVMGQNEQRMTINQAREMANNTPTPEDVGSCLELNQIEPVFSLAFEQMRSEIQNACSALAISPDPMQWSCSDVQSWLTNTLASLTSGMTTLTTDVASISEMCQRQFWNIEGRRLCSLNEEEFRRLDPVNGDYIFAQFELWKMLQAKVNVGASTSANPTSALPPIPPMQQAAQPFDFDQLLLGSELPQSGSNMHAHNDNSCSADGAADKGRKSPTLSMDSSSNMSSCSSDHAMSPARSSASSFPSPCGPEPMNTDDEGEESEEDVKPIIIKTEFGSPAPTGTISNVTSSSSTSSSATATTKTSKAKSSALSGTTKTGAHIHLWQFLKELLASPQQHGSCIRWLDQSRGVFKIEDSVRVARLWGLRKNRPAMNYDKLSRSIRQYYRKGIMRKTERSQRLVYQFCHPYGL